MPDSVLPLKGRTVVITRPVHQAHAFRALLEHAGATVILFPVFAIVPTVQAPAVFSDLAQYDVVIFISTNAVTCANVLLTPDQHKTLTQCMLASIGKKTAAALSAIGLTAHWVAESGYTSEDLLALPALQNMTNQRVLIIRGEGGRDALAHTLQLRGAHVEYANVYQRGLPEITHDLLKIFQQSTQIDIIALTSSEGIHNLLTILENSADVKHLTLLLGSQRMLETARNVGFSGSIILADDPSDESMYHALTQWAQESNHD